MDNKKLRAFVVLQEKRRDLDNELKDVKDKLNDLQGDLLKEFEAAGIQSIKVGSFTVFLARTIYAGPVIDKEDLIKALKRARLGYLVKESYNHNSISAYARQLEADKKKMPKSLVGHMKTTETFKVTARKG